MMNQYARGFLVVLISVLSGVSLAVDLAYGVDGVVLINQRKALSGNVTPGDTPGFPVTLSRWGSYRLYSNLRVPNGNTHGIEVTSSNVTIDLNGFTIRGPGVSGSGDGVSSTYERTTVINGVVTGLGGYGIRIVAQARISGLHVEANGAGGIGSFGGGIEGSIVSDNTVVSNRGPGIFLLGSGDLVSGNTLWYNTGIGIHAGGGCIVKGNAVYSSGGHGVFAANGGLVIGNTARSNFGLGLHLDQDVGYKDNVLTDNNGGSANQQVAGGIQIGTNVCGNDTDCP